MTSCNSASPTGHRSIKSEESIWGTSFQERPWQMGVCAEEYDQEKKGLERVLYEE